MRRKRYARPTAHDLAPAPFASAEEAWFWFVRCHRARRDGARFGDSSAAFARPCDPDDVYRAARGLARSGRIDRPHLEVLESYGLMDRPPDPRCREEQTPSRLWDEALDRMTTVLRRKGIVE